MNKPLFPIALNLTGRTCIVIGSTDNREAKHKAKALEECGAVVLRIHDPAAICDEDLTTAFFVLSAVRDASLSERLQRFSEKYGFLLWCVDQPSFGSVSMMAIAKSGPVRLAASTSGVAPSVSKAFRKGLERAMDRKFVQFVTQLGALRRELRERLPHATQAHERIDKMLDASRRFEVSVTFSYPEWFDG